MTTFCQENKEKKKEKYKKNYFVYSARSYSQKYYTFASIMAELYEKKYSCNDFY